MKEIKLINFIDLNYEEKNMVLEWRNRLDIQKMMYSQSDIPLEKHLEFIDSLRVITDKLYFLVKKDNIYIGVIDFTQIKQNESLHMGVYTNPNF